MTMLRDSLDKFTGWLTGGRVATGNYARCRLLADARGFQHIYTYPAGPEG